VLDDRGELARQRVGLERRGLPRARVEWQHAELTHNLAGL